jgi:hypothetical protein
LRGTVSLRCPNCNRSFRVLEDEQSDHCCPFCGQEEEKDPCWEHGSQRKTFTKLVYHEKGEEINDD